MAKNREIEVKIRIADAAGLMVRLKALSARKVRSVFEENVLFDTKDEAFREREAILRLRREVPVSQIGRWASRRAKRTGEGILTFKGLLKRKSAGGERYKEREEIEFRIQNAKRLEGVLRRIGMRTWFRYEKYRSEYRSRRFPGLKLDLDQTPMGIFLELEGPRREIQRAARALGHSSREYITASYLELYAAECARRGSKLGNMTFQTQKNRGSVHSVLDKICECS